MTPMQSQSRASAHAPALALLLACALASPPVPATEAEPETLEEVRVEDAPGPLMWRVSKDDHVLWIIGTITPLPKELKWNTRQLEAVVQESGEVIGSSRFGLALTGGNAWTLVRNLPGLLRLRKNPDKALLRDLLPPEQYARWRSLHVAATGKEPDEGDEMIRPMLLADGLYYQSLEALGLVERDVVAPRLARLAAEHKVPVRRRVINVPAGDVKQIKDMMAEFRALPRDRELECLVATMDFIERELPRAGERARAWAIGDQAQLAEDLSVLTREPCTLAALRDSSIKERLDQLETEVRQDFLDAAGYALLGRETSVTTLPMQFIAGPRSLLDTLRASGYVIETPRGEQGLR